MNPEPFKVCPNCSTVLNTLEAFLSDPKLEYAGYQINFADLEGGLFYFTHATQSCGTTMAVAVKAFSGLSSRPLLAKQGKQPGGKCSGACLRAGDSSPCPVECECVWVREVMQIILGWRKHSA
jgi:hypothetical protein